MNGGVYVKGILSGSDMKISEYDGNMKTTYRYLIISGMDSFLVSSEDDFSRKVSIGEEVCFRVTPRSYNQKIYYTRGDLINEQE